MRSAKRWLETHFGTTLLLSCVAGLALPQLALVPDAGIVAMIAVATFIACFCVDEESLRSIRWKEAACFLGLRFLILPLSLLGIASFLLPAYAPGIFLLALLPPGISSPALVNLFGGRVTLAFALTIPCALAMPFYIPGLFALTGQAAMSNASPLAMFATLAYAVLLPIALYATLGRRSPRLRLYIKEYDRAWSILLVAAVIAIVIAKQRGVMLADPLALLPLFAIVVPCCVLFMAVGWYGARRAAREERIAYAVCSSFNNAALGVSLALLHFPSGTVLLMVVMEVCWAGLPLLFRMFLRGK